MTDEELMIQYQTGDESAFETIYNRHVGKIKAFIITRLRHFLNCSEDAEDITQQVFFDFYTNRDKFPKDAKVKAWLMSIAWHKLIDWVRFEKRNRRCRDDDETMSESTVGTSNPAEDAMYNEIISQFEKWVASSSKHTLYPSGRSTILELGTAEEIAEKTGIPNTAVRYFRREGVKKIKELCA